MDLSCFVRVHTEADGKPVGGTGYLIRKDRVLTAAHLVGEAGSAAAIDVDRPGSGGVLSLAAVVIWRGVKQDCDIALLRLLEPLSFDLPLPILAEVPLSTAKPWESRGWATVAPEEHRVRDSMVDLLGEASAFEADQKRMQLTVSPEPQEVGYWHGISGAPVFQRGETRRLLGVIAAVPKAFTNALWATPLTQAFLQPGFREALGEGIPFARRRQLIEAITRLLEESPLGLREAVVENYPAWKERFSHGGVSALVEEMLAVSNVVAVLSQLEKTHRTLLRREEASRGLIDNLEVLLLSLTAVLVQNGILHLLPDEEGGVLLSIPVTSATFAELAVAGFEGRTPWFRPRGERNPIGQGLEALPGEEGFDAAGEDKDRAMAESLKQKYLHEDDLEWLSRLERGGSASSAKVVEETYRLLNDELELQAQFLERPLRRYVAYRTDYGRENASFLENLRRRLPAITLVEMQGEDYVSERRICRLLATILARTAITSEERKP